MRATPILSGSLLCGLALSFLALSVAPATAQTAGRTTQPALAPDRPAKQPMENQANPGGNSPLVERLAAFRRRIPQKVVEHEDAYFHDINPLDAAFYRAITRGDLNGLINWPGFIKAQSQAMQMHLAARANAAQPNGINAFSLQPAPVVGRTGPGLPSTLPPSGWQFIGPNNISHDGSNFGDGTGPYTGRINAAAYDPNQAQTLYIASDNGGIWKSLNAGATWTPLTDGLPTLAFSSIAVDPFNSKHLLAGSGDYDGAHTIGVGFPGDERGVSYGLWQSTDGGQTWSQTTAATGLHVVRKILFDPKNQGHILIPLGRDKDYLSFNGANGVSGTILTSTDGGQSWRQAFDQNGQLLNVAGYFNNIVYDRNNQNLYASADFAGIYASYDNGATWTGPLGSPPVAVTTTLNSLTARVDVATSPTDPNTLYVLSDNDQALYKSTDGGQTWTDSTNGLPFEGQNEYDFYLAVSKATLYDGDPGTEPPPPLITTDVLYVGELDVFQSPDAGQTWNTITFTYTGNDTIHTDQHAFAVNPHDPNEFLAGNDGGIYRGRFRPNRGDVAWDNLNATLHVTELYSGAADALGSNSYIALGASQDNGSFEEVGDASQIAGSPWYYVYGGDGIQSWINPTNSHNQYTSYIYGTLKQTDDDWTTNPINIGVPGGGNFIFPFAPSNSSEFVYSGNTKLYAYDHGVATAFPDPAGKWNALATVTATEVTAVGPSPIGVDTNQGHMDIAFTGTWDGLLWAVLTNGTTGTPIEFDNHAVSNPFALPQLPITAIVGSAVKPLRTFVGLGATGFGTPHLYRCDDFTAGTPQFIPISGVYGDGFHTLPDVSINSLVVLPRDDEKVMFVGTDVGVFYTIDGGLNWNSAAVIPGASAGQFLPTAPVSQLHLTLAGDLVAVTYGRGIWMANLGAAQPLQLLPRIPGYVGGKSKLNATLDLFHAGQQVVEDNAALIYDGINPSDPPTPAPYKYFTIPTETRKISLTPAGYVKLPVSSVGAFDIYLTVDHCIRKNVAGVNTKKKAVTTTTLILGDVDGDNAIDGSDLGKILAAIQSGVVYTKSALDVNGDGKVDIRDYNLVRAVLLRYGGFVQGD